MRLLSKIDDKIEILVADSNYTIIKTATGKKYTSSYSLYILEQELGFIRINRSVSICPTIIISLEKNIVRTTVGEFTISRRKINQINEKIININTPAFCCGSNNEGTTAEIIANL